jgi:trans-aconitate methyltransferase
MQFAAGLRLPQQRRCAIDFGCGVGRLTRALHEYFPQACGVDISAGMLQKARELTPDCEFREAKDLSSFPAHSADLIYSSLVLQHQPDTKNVKRIIQDMLRVLAPGGLLVFQLPVGLPMRNRIQLRRRAYRFLRAFGVSHRFAYERLKLTPIRMLSLPRDAVEDIIREAHGTVISVEEKMHRQFFNGIYYCTLNA